MLPCLRLHPSDDVAIACTQLSPGQVVDGLTVRGLIPPGHKLALRDIAAGEAVRRYNQIIGFASRAIAAGQHVHTHNLGVGTQGGDLNRDHAFCRAAKTPPALKTGHFMGIRRGNRAIATRNYIGILTSVNCSATVARSIARHFCRQTHPEALADFANIDGVVALTHGSGCAMDSQGEGLRLLRRTLAGYAAHPNFAAVLLIGLGCEANQLPEIVSTLAPAQAERIHTLNIQDVGGTAQAVAQGIARVKELLPTANAVKREPCPLSALTVGLQCGGSDGYSGISANPALGRAVDLLVEHGGTAILSETPEIYGAEHLLTQRAVTPAVAEKLLARLAWWQDYVARNQGEMDNNPSPGNKAGGLTTILEKSLGAVAKAGTGNLNAVYEYAEAVREHGFVFMDTPGFDPVSATGQIAGGANLLCFTTGRGSAYGAAPVPSLKLATNTALWQRQGDDMDLNCGEIIDGTCSLEEMGQRIFAAMIATASGKKTRSEVHGYGQDEFVPWQIGAVM